MNTITKRGQKSVIDIRLILDCLEDELKLKQLEICERQNFLQVCSKTLSKTVAQLLYGSYTATYSWSRLYTAFK